MFNDLRMAVRALRGSPGFTAAAVLTLALAIGGTTAIFGLVNGVLLRPLPFSEPERLVEGGHALPGEYVLFRERASSFGELALRGPVEGANLTVAGEPERVAAVRVTPDLFRTLGVAPLRGRAFLPEEGRPGTDRVVLLSHGLWQERFGGDPAVVGRDILIDSESRTVVGVMPPGFRFPGARARLWLPLAIDPSDPVALWGGGGGWLVGRLAPGATAARAEAELRGLGPRVREANTLWAMTEDYGADRRVIGLREAMVGDVRTPLLVLLGAVGFVLLIACANVANLLLVRSSARRREMAIRTALGAGRRRIARQLLGETLVLSALGGGAGLLLAVAATGVLKGALPFELPRLGEVAIDLRVLGFTAAVTLLTGLVFGLLPALRASRADLQEGLRSGSHGSGDGPRQRALASTLVSAEFALAAMLVIGAGLMGRSFLELTRVDAGFEVERLVSARVTPPSTRYGEPERQREFHAEVLARVRALPGLGATELVDRLPLAEGEGFWGGFAFESEDSPYVPGTAAPTVAERRVSHGYTRVMGIPLLAGRPLDDRDREGTPHVALINRAMAHQVWPGEDPIGKRFRPVWWRDEWITVVGLVGDVRQRGLGTEPEPEIYRPLRQAPPLAATLVTRTSAGAGAVAGMVRRAVATVDPHVPVSEVRPLEEVRAGALAEPRLITLLLGVFAALALGLGVIGIYGVVAYAVSQRTREFGVRMALGARAADILRLVIGQGVRLVGLGGAIGLVAAFAMASALEGLLFGVTGRDPVTFAAVPLLLGVAALAASWIPARRATRVDPTRVLKAD